MNLGAKNIYRQGEGLDRGQGHSVMCDRTKGSEVIGPKVGARDAGCTRTPYMSDQS